MIELRGVTKVYRNGDVETPVLHGIDLTIRAGEFVAIMGASGSGKSTLMNILGCLDRPSAGSYRFLGRDVSQLGRDELARLRREAFGFVFQQYNLIATASALRNVEVPAVYAGMPAAQRRTRARELLAKLGLADRLEHRPSQLSGGQQQRVSIARALMNGGRILLADEPTGALDSKSGREVMALLRDLSRQGHTVVIITHAREVAEQAGRVIEIADGRLIRDPGPAPRETQGEQQLPPPAHRSSSLGGTLEAGRVAVAALRANLFRTALTLLGIVIGVASVIAMLAVGNGAKEQVLERIGNMGSNLLLVRPGAPNMRGAAGIATLTMEDAAAIRELPNVLASVPEMGGGVTVRYGNTDYQTQANASGAELPRARVWPLARGSFFTEQDVRDYAAVAVLGDTVARTLFGAADPLGSHVLVNNVLFQVIGVMQPRGAAPSGADQDDVVIVPVSTGGLRLFGQTHLRAITVAVQDVSRIDATQEAVAGLLEARHRTIDFQIRNMAAILDTVMATQTTLTVLLGSIAAISLLVGGIGVMNIMLVSVTERTREIGIRMATGARMRDILQQFLGEALTVSALGGLVGVAVGLGAAAAIGHFGMPVGFSAGPVVLAFACAFATGLVFGYMPARKAARLDPVVALAAE